MMNSFHKLLDDLEEEHITLSHAKNMFGSREANDNKLIIQKLSNGLQICQISNWTTFAHHWKSCSDIESVISEQCRKQLKPLPWIERITRKIYEWSEVHKLKSTADCACAIIRELNINLNMYDKSNLDLFTSQQVCDMHI